MKEVSAEMDATMKDGSHRKFALCQNCLMDWLDHNPPNQGNGW